MNNVTKDLLEAMKEVIRISDRKHDAWDAAKAAIARAEAALDKLKPIHTNGNREMTMKDRNFTAGKDGFISDNNFDFDAGLKVSGDFVGGEKQRYAEMIAAALNKVSEAALAEPWSGADGWIPWAGGECPVDEKVLVEVKLRSGSAWIDQEAQMGADWIWEHNGGVDDITAYRVLEAQP